MKYQESPELTELLKRKGYLIKKARLAADLKRYDLLPEIESDFEQVNKEIAHILEEEERERKNKKRTKRRTSSQQPIIN